jgi:hypothetical protein
MVSGLQTKCNLWLLITVISLDMDAVQHQAAKKQHGVQHTTIIQSVTLPRQLELTILQRSS